MSGTKNAKKKKKKEKAAEVKDLAEEYGAPFAIYSQQEGDRYVFLLSRGFNPPRCLDFELIQSLGAADGIDSYCRTLGWEKFVKMKHDGYQQLMLEFYTTLNFSDDSNDNDDAEFSCRLMGKSVRVTRKTLCDIFGFYEKGHTNVPKNFDEVQFFEEISGLGDYEAKTSSGLIRDPILLIMQKYISHVIFGRFESSKVGKKDLFYLWCLSRELGICTPSFLFGSFKSVICQSRAHMGLGNFITAIAVYFGVFDPEKTDMTVVPMRVLGLDVLKRAEICVTRTKFKDVKERRCYKVLKASSSRAPIEGTPAAPTSDTTEPMAVDQWILVSNQLEKMQMRMNDGFDAMNARFNTIDPRFDAVENKVKIIAAHFKIFGEQEIEDLKHEKWTATKTVEEMKHLEANKTIDELRLKVREFEKAAEMYKSRLEKLSPRIKKIEENLANMVTVKMGDLVNLVNDVRELATLKEGGNLDFPDSTGLNKSSRNGSTPDDAENVVVLSHGVPLTPSSMGSRSKVLSSEGDINIVQSCIRENDAHTVKYSPGSRSGRSPPQPESIQCKEPLGSGEKVSERSISTSLHISELTTHVKHTFREHDFSEVQKILINRENHMKLETENLTRDRDSAKKELCLLEQKMDLKELERLKLDEKLQKCQRKCEDLEEKVTRLLEEKRLSNDREKRAEERCDKIAAENSKIAFEKSKSVFQLNENINELKNKNFENERLVGVYQEKCKCLDIEIAKKGQKIEELMLKQLEGDRVVEGLKEEIFEVSKTIDELWLKKSESDKEAEAYNSPSDNLWRRITKIEENHADMLTVKVGDIAGIVHDVSNLANSEDEGNLNFPDSRGKKDSSRAGVVLMSRGVCLASHSNASRFKGLSEKGARTSGTQSSSGAGHFSKTAFSSPAGEDIIQIIDSDDEENHPARAPDISKGGMDSNVGENEINFVHTPVSSQRSKRKNQTDCMVDLYSNSTTKRKKETCTGDENIVLVDEKENNVLSDEVSTKSVESYSESKMKEFIASFGSRKKFGRKFVFEADMLRAFQQDDELCVNAVCALYRQEVAARKSKGGSNLSKSGGFSPVDSVSDKELRLRKSVAEVKEQHPDVISQCRKLANIYIEKIFEIFCSGTDHLFGQ